MVRNLTCISCPVGCYLTVSIEEGKVMNVSGNRCKKGVVYAESECTTPLRVVTSTVKINNGFIRVVPVKTGKGIPKEKIFQCLKVLKDVQLEPPIKVGDVIVPNICETGVNVIATRSVLN